MKKRTYNTKMIGMVTLYNPIPQETINNIKRYINDVDTLIIWDNSSLSMNLKATMLDCLNDFASKIVWKGDGNNYYIARAINFTWQYAQKEKYDLMLIMDQDSQWEDFSTYRLQIEQYWRTGNQWVFTPYITNKRDADKKTDINNYYFIRLFINSGTVIPIDIMNDIDGADETFALDALDHDLAIRIQKVGYKIICIPNCTLYHTVGHPKRSRFLKLFTEDYGRERTYSIAKTHLIKFRKHKSWLTCYEKRKIFKEYYMWKLIRIIFVEGDKLGRLKMMLKGIRDGINYDLTKTKQ